MSAMKCKIVEVWKTTAFNANTSALTVGEMLKLSSTKVVPLAAATDDATFCGISMSEIKATEQDGDPVLVLVNGLIEINLTSAAYAFGAGLKWASNNSLVADGGADTIAWIWDNVSGVRASGIVMIDVAALRKLVVTASA